MTERRHYPSQSDLETPAGMERSLRAVIDDVYAELRRIETQPRAPISTTPGGGSTTATSPTSVTQVTNVTEVSTQNVSLDIIRAALQATGTHPLSVTGLYGLLRSYQDAKVAEVTALPSQVNSIDGQLAFYDSNIYRYNATAQEWELAGGAGSGTTASILQYGFYSTRPSAPPEGTLYYATDRRVLHLYATIGVTTGWWYIAGTHYTDTLASKPTLTATDINYLYYSREFGHLWRWTGTAWLWGPGEIGSNYVQLFCGNPPLWYDDDMAFNTWQLCNGATVTRCKGNATTTSVTVPNVGASVADGTGLYFKATAGLYVAPGDLEWGGTSPLNPNLVGSTVTTLDGTGAQHIVAGTSHVHDAEVNHISLNAYYRR